MINHGHGLVLRTTRDLAATLPILLRKLQGFLATSYFRGSLHSASIAQRMCWASERKTKRKEDNAYCLRGIFDVNMLTLNGEGEKAFIRLQEEIMKESSDESLFAWGYSLPFTEKRGRLLAQSPADSANWKDTVRFPMDTKSSRFFVTNRGLQIKLVGLEM